MKTSWLLPLLAGLSPVYLSAQRAPDARTASPPLPSAVAARAEGPIRVDGVLDEAAWSRATPVTGFTQLDPMEGSAGTERTEVRILYDAEALYVGARLEDRQAVSSRLGRRDMESSASDWLSVLLDSNHDRRTAYGFEVNPSGVRGDRTLAGEQSDDSWDPVWEARTSVTATGWVAEMRIPFSQLRFTGAGEQTWGLQIERTIARNQEVDVWSFTPRDRPGGIPRYGMLEGLRSLSAGKRLEVLPYAVARAEYIDPRGNPYRTPSEYRADGGVDLKYRMTSNLTLDATVNPDFGQVEVDPAVVNLTAFETFFPEKRPFFVEGAEIFRFGNDGTNSVFYSRRIGKQPTLSPPYPAADVPRSTRILGAGKLSGRTAGGWSVGVLDAVTQRERARFLTPGGEEGAMVAEPLTNYMVSRVRRETRQGQTAVGGFVGAVNRSLDTEALAGALRSSAYSGGVDLFHQWDRRTWTLTGFLAGSRVTGEPEVIAATQRLPYHYFQRPDAGHLSYDPDRTSLSGLAGSLNLGKQVGRHWRLGGGANTITPGYEVSDLGFQRRADRVDLELDASYQETRPGPLLRRYGIYVTELAEHNYAWDLISHRIFTTLNTQLLSYWTNNLQFVVGTPGTLDDRLTRGGPAARRPGYLTVYDHLSTDPRRTVVGYVGAGVDRRQEGGWSRDLYGGATLKPAPNWELSLSPSYSRGHDPAQFLRSLPDPLAARTYGARYVFAELDQTTIALEARLNYTFSPSLSLQAYAQPFVATGAFGPPKEFAAPGTYDFLVYGRDVGEVVDGRVYPSGRSPDALSFPVPHPDFNVRSLRGNAVLRWEWRPGSTLYLAWQQTRDDYRPIGDFDLGRDVDAVFAAAPDDVFLVKVSYWLNP